MGFGINFNELPAWQRRGTGLYWERYERDAVNPRTGEVGVVTQLIPGASFDPASTVAMSCGPEIMMRFVARGLVSAGVARDRIHVSLERSMHCGIGRCGHCQLGPTLICRDGPVYPWSVAEPLIAVRGL